MSEKKDALEHELHSAEVAIENSLGDTTVLGALGEFGYDKAAILKGRSLCVEARKKFEAHKVEYGEQYAATAELERVWKESGRVYMRSIKVARIAFKNDEKARTALILGGTRKVSLAGWLDQSRTFYANLLEDQGFVDAMARFGYNRKKLEAESSLVQEVSRANLAQEREKGDAQKATEVRDDKLDALADWISDFRAIARVAFEDDPQMLEKLGF